jgi:hypothetical protein
VSTPVPPRANDRATAGIGAPTPGLELITRLDATLSDPIDLGLTPDGHRRVVPITGGRLHGPRVTGEILSGGADWQIVHPDGWVTVEARYTVRSDSGLPISVISRGVRHGPPDVMARLLAGEAPDPSEYRFRTAMTFEVEERSDLGWLNHVLAISSAVRDPAAVHIDVYEVT